MSSAIENYVKVHSKSQIVGFLLTFFLGPIGLFYSSWIAALILLLVAIATAATIIGPVFCWLVSVIYTFFAVGKYNERISATAQLGSVS